MPDGPGRFAPDSSCPGLLRIPLGFRRLRVRGSHPLWPAFPDRSARPILAVPWSCNPRGSVNPRVWAFPLSLAATPGIIDLFSFPAGNKMFQFPTFAHDNSAVCRTSARRVPPFGHPRIPGHVHLPAAFRSLSRPSSPPGAKASAHCPSLLLVFLLSRFARSYFVVSFFQGSPRASAPSIPSLFLLHVKDRRTSQLPSLSRPPWRIAASNCLVPLILPSLPDRHRFFIPFQPTSS